MGLGSDANVRALIRVSAPPGSPAARDTHCPSERRIHHRFVLRCSAAVLKRDAFGRALWISTCGYLIHSIRVGASIGQRGREPLITQHTECVIGQAVRPDAGSAPWPYLGAAWRSRSDVYTWPKRPHAKMFVISRLHIRIVCPQQDSNLRTRLWRPLSRSGWLASDLLGSGAGLCIAGGVPGLFRILPWSRPRCLVVRELCGAAGQAWRAGRAGFAASAILSSSVQPRPSVWRGRRSDASGRLPGEPGMTRAAGQISAAAAGGPRPRAGLGPMRVPVSGHRLRGQRHGHSAHQVDDRNALARRMQWVSIHECRSRPGAALPPCPAELPGERARPSCARIAAWVRSVTWSLSSTRDT